MSDTWTREILEQMKGHERPSIRCKIGERETTGRLIPDVNPWVEIWQPNSKAGGPWRAEQLSWSLVLLVLNDRFAAPIYFEPKE